MKSILISTALACCLTSPLATADTYRGELDLLYQNDEIDGTSGQLGFTWYFQPVTTSFKKIFKKTIKHPLGESAFLEQASSMSVKYRLQQFDELSEVNFSKYDFDESDIGAEVVDGLDVSTTRIAIDYFIPKSIFFLGVQYYRTTLETSENNDSDIKLNSWGLTGGIMLTDNFLLTTNYQQDKDYNVNLAAKYVAELGGGTAVNFLASYARLDNKDTQKESLGDDAIETKEENLVTLSADYYFTRQLSLGTGLIYADKTGYEFRTQYFFTDAISARGMFRTIDNNNTFAIGLSARL